MSTPWTQDVNWTYIRRSADVQDVFWKSYVRSIYILCPGGNLQKNPAFYNYSLIYFGIWLIELHIFYEKNKVYNE